MSKELTAMVFIPGVTPEHVWPLVSTGPQLTQWFAEHAEVHLPEGVFRFWGKFTPDVPGPDSQHVQLGTWSAPDANGEGGRLNFAWQLRGQATQVGLTLAPRDGGTEVAVHHSALHERLTEQGAVHDFWYTVLENLRLLAVTAKPQALPQWGPKPGPSLQVQVDIAAPPAQIFRCLIEPEWMAKLWEDKQITVEPHPGGVYDYGWKDGGPKRIVEIDPPHLLSFTWRYPPETEDSVVTWRLAEQAGGVTRLTLEHQGFSADHDDEGYRAGWFSFLAIIKGINELGDAWARVQITGSEHGEA